MPTPDDISGGITDAGKVVLRDEGQTLDAVGEFHYVDTGPSPSGPAGAFYMRDSEGIFNPRELNPGGPPGTYAYARIAVPVQIQETSNNTYTTLGTLFYKFAALDGANLRIWDGYYDSQTTMDIRIFTALDGLVLAEVTGLTGFGSVQLTLNPANLPTGDDVLLLQARRASGGGGSKQRIFAGFYSFEP